MDSEIVESNEYESGYSLRFPAIKRVRDDIGLDQVDTLNNGSKCNYVDHRITWSFQYNLLQLSNLVDKTILYKFEKTGNVLKLNNPCMFDRSIGDTLITDVDVLRQYGVNSLNESFTIMDITNSKMVLESDKLRLHFVKH